MRTELRLSYNQVAVLDNVAKYGFSRNLLMRYQMCGGNVYAVNAYKKQEFVIL